MPPARKKHSAVFSARGHRGSPAAVTAGFRPALWSCAVFAALAFRAADQATIDELCHPDLADHNPAPGHEPTLAGFKQKVAGFKALFPDLEEDLQDITASGDTVATRPQAGHLAPCVTTITKPAQEPDNVSGVVAVVAEAGRPASPRSCRAENPVPVVPL